MFANNWNSGRERSTSELPFDSDSLIRAQIAQACHEHDQLMTEIANEAEATAQKRAAKSAPPPVYVTETELAEYNEELQNAVGEAIGECGWKAQEKREAVEAELRAEIAELRKELTRVQGTVDAFASILRLAAR